MMESPGKLVYSPHEVAKLLGLSKNLLYQEIACGHIPSIRLSDRKIIIPRVQLEAWLAGKK
jgi:excisionase family DNA binding protein